MRDFQHHKAGYLLSQGRDEDGQEIGKPKVKSNAEIMADFDKLNEDYLNKKAAKNGSKA